MGQIVKVLSKCKIGNENVDIEYNEGYFKGSIDIHIQGSKIRYCCSDEEFMKLLTFVVCAKRKLDSIKQAKNDTEK